jgi:hypothetical protein
MGRAMPQWRDCEGKERVSMKRTRNPPSPWIGLRRGERSISQVRKGAARAAGNSSTWLPPSITSAWRAGQAAASTEEGAIMIRSMRANGRIEAEIRPREGGGTNIYWEEK